MIHVFIPVTVIGIVVLATLLKRAGEDAKHKRRARIAVASFVAVEATLICLAFVRPAVEEESLREHGVAHSAVIVSVEQTGRYMNKNPEVDLVLEVHPEDGRSYRVTKTRHVSQVDIAKYTEGTEVTVLVDPSDPQKVVLE